MLERQKNICFTCMFPFVFSVKLIQKQKAYYLKNRDQIIEYHKKYKKENIDNINSYEKNRRDSDLKFKLAHNIRVRTNKVFKSQSVRKSKNL